MRSVLSLRTPFLSALRPAPRPTFFIPVARPLQLRTYKKKRTFPKMSPVSTDDITARLAKLQVQETSKIVEHAAVKNGQEWREALKEKADGVVLTKTVSLFPSFPTTHTEPLSSSCSSPRPRKQPSRLPYSSLQRKTPRRRPRELESS